MAEGKRQEEWEFWGEHYALTANCHRGKGQKVFHSHEINPYKKARRKKDGKKGIGQLHEALNANFGGVPTDLDPPKKPKKKGGKGKPDHRKR